MQQQSYQNMRVLVGWYHPLLLNTRMFNGDSVMWRVCAATKYAHLPSEALHCKGFLIGVATMCLPCGFLTCSQGNSFAMYSA